MAERNLIALWDFFYSQRLYFADKNNLLKWKNCHCRYKILSLLSLFHLLPLWLSTLIYMHMRRNMCKTTAPSRVKNYSWGTNRFLWGCSASVYSQIFCTQPAICYAVKTVIFFFSGCKGKLIAKRTENLFSYWRGVAGCQDGEGQLWGKAGRPAAFCLSHALLHRVCDKTSLQEYWANTETRTGIHTISCRNRSQKASYFQRCLLSPFLME